MNYTIGIENKLTEVTWKVHSAIGKRNGLESNLSKIFLTFGIWQQWNCVYYGRCAQYSWI
jgi:hypothetical protein